MSILKVISAGSAERFKNVEVGDAFLFSHESKTYAGIKVLIDKDDGFVVIPPGRKDGVPELWKETEAPNLVFSISEPHLLLPKDLTFVATNLGESDTDPVGFKFSDICLLSEKKVFLAFCNKMQEPNTICFLDVDSGEILKFDDYKDTSAIVVSQWDLVGELLGDTVTLFTHS
jgi:hypothetical protein